jgi:hypothetical protein
MAAAEEPLPSLNPAETAVLICKFQNDFAAEGGKIYETVKEVMEITNMKENSIHFVDLARKAGCTIVHCPISLERVSYFYISLWDMHFISHPFRLSHILPIATNAIL